MINRRSFIAGIGISLAAAPREAAAHKPSETFLVDPAYLPQRVTFPSEHVAGTIVVDTAGRFLYLVEEPRNARRYGIGVGRAGLAWSGAAEVGRKAKWPSWTPTANMIRREPRKYAKYANGVPVDHPTRSARERSICIVTAATPITGFTAPPSRGRSEKPFRTDASA